MHKSIYYVLPFFMLGACSDTNEKKELPKKETVFTMTFEQDESNNRALGTLGDQGNFSSMAMDDSYAAGNMEADEMLNLNAYRPEGT